jgi:hypothetical protein
MTGALVEPVQVAASGVVARLAVARRLGAAASSILRSREHSVPPRDLIALCDARLSMASLPVTAREELA